MKYYYHGGFGSTAEYYAYLRAINNADVCNNSDSQLNSFKKAKIMGYADSISGLLRYDKTPTRVQRLAEARDAFVHMDSNTIMYQVTKRVQNAKGETIGIEIFRVNKIKQIGLDFLAKFKALKIKIKFK